MNEKESFGIHGSGMVIAKLGAGGFKEQIDEKTYCHCYHFIRNHNERDALGCSDS